LCFEALPIMFMYVEVKAGLLTQQPQKNVTYPHIKNCHTTDCLLCWQFCVQNLDRSIGLMCSTYQQDAVWLHHHTMDQNYSLQHKIQKLFIIIHSKTALSSTRQFWEYNESDE